MANETISGNTAAWNAYQASMRHIDRLQDPTDRWAAWERLKWHVEQHLDRTKVFAPQLDDVMALLGTPAAPLTPTSELEALLG